MPSEPIVLERQQSRHDAFRPIPAPTAVVANINSVRGLACLLVVALHVVGDAPTNGLHLPMTSNWHYLITSIEFLRKPLFTALSGYLYAGRRVTRPQFAAFWMKKARRLGVPLVSVTIIVWLLRRSLYAEQTPLLDALLFSFGHLWYVQSLIILFAVISVWDGLLRPGPVALVLVGLATIMMSQSGLTVTTFFSLAGAIYLAPYFIFGIILRDRSDWLRDARVGALALGIVVIVQISQQLGLFGLINPVKELQLPAALAGMACVVYLLQRLPRNRLLATIGGYSYAIYLWHVVASSAMRSALIKAGVVSVPVLFALSFVAALIAPIILYHLARRIPLLSVALTGEHRLRRPRAATAPPRDADDVLLLPIEVAAQ
jgi:peptidoglycan/LPS O-acetylase OafA/YrhL